MICDYGCDNDASFFNKRKKKWCCQPKAHSCPAVRQRNSQRQKNPEYQKKRKETLKGKYGVDNYNNLEKAKETSRAKYGTDNPAQSDIVKDKIKKTNLERYGVEYSWQATVVKEKIKATCKEKYGDENYRNVEKQKQTMIEKYGVDNPGKTENSITQASKRKTKTTRKKMRKTWANKTVEEKRNIIDLREERHGYRTPFLDAKNRRSFPISKKETLWIDSLNNLNIIRQHCFEDLQIVVDGYDPTTNTVYLFHGDFWHGNPKIYELTNMNPRAKKTFGNLYQNTLDYEKKIIYAGYELVIMWESDYDKI